MYEHGCWFNMMVPTTLFKSVRSSSHEQSVPTCMNKPVTVFKPVSSIYISGVRSSGHRLKPNMAAMEALSYVGFSLPTRSFMYTCYVKIAQGDWNRRNSGPPCPTYLASLFAQSATGRSHSIYMYIYGAHWFKLASSTMFTPVNKLKQDVRFYVRSLN